MAHSRTIVIAGGGYAGIRAARTLAGAGAGRWQVRLVSRGTVFRRTPALNGLIAGQEPQVELPLARLLGEHAIDAIEDDVLGIDPARRSLVGSRSSYAFDAAILATGARADATRIPGLKQRAILLTDEAGFRRGRALLDEVIADAVKGQRRSIEVVCAPGYARPETAFDILLHSDDRLRQAAVRDRVALRLYLPNDNTFPGGPGDDAPGPGRALAKIDVEIVRNTDVTAVIEGHLITLDGRRIRTDALLALPPLNPSVVYGKLPRDGAGFVRIDSATGAVPGFPRIAAAGDGASTHRKQAFVALRQGEAAARYVADDLGEQVAAADPPDGGWQLAEDLPLLPSVQRWANTVS